MALLTAYLFVLQMVLASLPIGVLVGAASVAAGNTLTICGELPSADGAAHQSGDHTKIAAACPHCCLCQIAALPLLGVDGSIARAVMALAVTPEIPGGLAATLSTGPPLPSRGPPSRSS